MEGLIQSNTPQKAGTRIITTHQTTIIMSGSRTAFFNYPIQLEWKLFFQCTGTTTAMSSVNIDHLGPHNAASANPMVISPFGRGMQSRKL
jgi:hypothetical protein